MSNARIMIVIGDVSAEYVKQTLDRLGYDVLSWVASGKTFVEQAKHFNPDLILLGSEWIGDGRDPKPETAIIYNSDIPIVYLISTSDEAALHHVKSHNIYGCLVQPFTSDQLHLTIEVALQTHRREQRLKKYHQVDILLKRRNQELNLLNQAGQVFISTLDLDQVLTSVLEEIQDNLNVVACSAWLVDTSSQEIVCRQVTDPHSAVVRGWRLPIGQGLVGEVALSGKSLVVSDILTDPRHFKGVDERTGLNLRSILSVPLRIKEQVIGVIQVVDEAVNRFDQSHLELLESLAATAAIAIENGRLYEESNKLRRFNENIINSMEEGLLIIDPNYDILFINPKGTLILGYEANQLIHNNILDFIAIEDKEHVAAKLTWHKSGVATKYETVIITKDGEEIPILFSTSSLFEDEQFIGILAVFVDISRRKKTDELLRKLSRAVEQTADHMIITNNVGIIEYVNPAFQQLTGFTGTDVIGKTPRILKSNQHSPEFYKRMWTVINSGQVFRDVVINKKKSGTLFYEEQTITPIKDANGHITHFVSTGKDITERRLSEQALKEAVEVLRRRNRELEALNRAGRKLSSSLDLDEVLSTVLEEAQQLLGALACSIWLIDPKTAKNKNSIGELVCHQAIGPHHETVQGWRLSPGEGVAGWVAQSGESLIIPDLTADSRHFKGVDRQIGLNLRSLISVPLKRVTHGVIGVLHILDEAVDRFNITDLVMVESLAATATVAVENAQLFAQVQQDAKTKTVLLDEINHRVKNNLSAIIGLLFAEQSRIRADDHTLYQSIVEDLINRVQSLATVHSLLSDAEWAPLSLERLAEQITHSALRGLTLNQNVFVEISSSPVRVSPAQAHYLAMVINELTTNAVKHGFSNIEKHAEIRITIHQQTEASRQWVVFEFRDNGRGYPEELLQGKPASYSVGFDLIRNIVERSLRGNLTLYNNSGAVAVIQFELISSSGLNALEHNHDK
ncbi:MAG: GAF domain-containing protein [Anaerolineae bacterium]|nr:GAF domain-containing protein [Anaerolineae bacterium]